MLKKIHSPNALAVTTTVDIDDAPQGSCRKLFAFVEVTTDPGAGVWSVTLNKRIGSEVVQVADVGAISATGIFVITLDAAFNGTIPNAAILIPDQIVFTEDTNGGVFTGNVYLGIA